MKTRKLRHQGQLLVELIIGIGTLAVMFSAIIPLFLVGVKASSESGRRQLAETLAQSQIEAVLAIKQENWNNIYRLAKTDSNGPIPYHVEESAGKWVISSGEQTKTLNGVIFTTKINFANVSRSVINGGTPAWQFGEIEQTFDSSREDPSTQKISLAVSWPGGTTLNYDEYLTRYQNSLWEETDWSGQTGTQVDTSIGGTLRLAKIPGGAAVPFGNQFIMNATTSIYSLTKSNYRLSMRFTAQNSGKVNQAQVYVSAVGKDANQTYFRYGLQGDNGGLPSGTYLGSGTANFSTTGWQIINFGSTAEISAGNVYHLVVEYDSGVSPSPSKNYIDLRASTPLAKLYPKDMTADTAANTYRYNGRNWKSRDYQPIYLLGFEDGTYEGNPYDMRESRSLYGNYFEAEKFTLVDDKKITGVELYTALSGHCTPSDSLNVSLQDLTDQKNIFDEALVSDPTKLTTAFDWAEHDLGNSYTLLGGHQYRLNYYSSGSDASCNYLATAVSSPGSAEFTNLTWDGVNSLTTRSANAGNTWSDLNNIDLVYALLINGDVYAPSGNLISKTFDTTNDQGGGFNRISWCARSLFDTACEINPSGKLPAGAAVKIQIAANNDNTSWNFVGPSGTASDYYTLSAGENLATLLSSTTNRYLKYKIYLERGTDPTDTPVVDWLRINWAK